MPPGYTSLAPLNREQHAGLGLRADCSYAWCAQLNSVYLGAQEIQRAALDYPVVFVRDNAKGEYFPAAVFGLRNNENLYVDAQGRWRPDHYVPAYVRRHPFCIAELPQPDGKEPQRLICVEEQWLAASPQPYFDARGEPTPAWKPMLELIEALEGVRTQTRGFARRLDAFGLLVPFDAVAMPASGAPLRLQGMHRVDEEKLKTLGERELRTLMRRNELRAVYAHLLSLENFAKLMAWSTATVR
jgi:hypothetical protein